MKSLQDLTRTHFGDTVGKEGIHLLLNQALLHRGIKTGGLQLFQAEEKPPFAELLRRVDLSRLQTRRFSASRVDENRVTWGDHPHVPSLRTFSELAGQFKKINSFSSARIHNSRAKPRSRVRIIE